MKQILSVTTVLIMALSMVSCSNGQNNSADGSLADNVNVEEFEKHLEGAQVLDVRTPQEWSEGIIEGATLANIYDDDFEARLEKLDKEKPVAVYCKSGGRSGKAMGMMHRMGFKEVYNLNGGMDAWKRADRPTVKP